MTITFYVFSKRTNSTKIVDVAGTTYNSCELKAETSVMTPVIKINAMPTVINPWFNYCYIPSFGRYYFINNWSWINGVWECEAMIDVLASFKTDIGNLTEYVLRSSYTFNPDIVDGEYITTTQIASYMDTLPITFVSTLTGGFYLIGIIGKDSTATQGAITYYQMTPAEMARLREFMLSDTFLQAAGVSNLANFVPADGLKTIFNPYQYIVSCQWFPLPASAIGSSYKTAVTKIDFGWWDTGTGFTAYRLNDNVPTYKLSGTRSIRSHPEADTRGKYLNHNPYTSMILRFPPFGEFQIPDETLDYYRNDVLEIEVDVEFITGIAYLSVYSQTGLGVKLQLLIRTSQKISVDIQLAQVSSDYLNTVTTAYRDYYNYINSQFSTGISAFTNINLDKPISSGLQLGNTLSQMTMASELFDMAALNDAMHTGAPQLLTSGVNGSLAAYKQIPYLCTTFHYVVADDNAQLGRPLCEAVQLNTIPGYILVKNPDVAMACLEQEKNTIKSFLASGFFYE